MTGWVLGDVRLPPWQRQLVADLASGEKIQMLVSPRPSRRQRVIVDAYLVIAAMLSEKNIVFASPDDNYQAEVRAEAERILERLCG